jgi:ornithine carbamoyltransferase
VSFELAVYQLGGHAVHLTGQEVGLGLREATRDIAYVLSGYLGRADGADVRAVARRRSSPSTHASPSSTG